MIGYKRRRRRRYWLLMTAVLPQLASLAAMAGMLWAVKIKDVISTSATIRREAQSVAVDISISAADQPKLQVGSVIHGTILNVSGQHGSTFTAQVTRIYQNDSASTRFLWKVEARLIPDARDYPKALPEPGHTVNVTMWTRTRRALGVVLNRTNFSGITGNTLSGNGSEGTAQ